MGNQPSAATARECKGSTPLSDDRSRSARATLRSSQRENPGQQRKTAAATAEEQPRRSNESEIVTGRRSASSNQLRKNSIAFRFEGAHLQVRRYESFILSSRTEFSRRGICLSTFSTACEAVPLQIRFARGVFSAA